MTIDDLKDSMNMCMEITFVYKKKEFFLEPDENSDNWLFFQQGKEDPEYLSYQGVINLKIDGKSLSEVLPMCTYINY